MKNPLLRFRTWLLPCLFALSVLACQKDEPIDNEGTNIAVALSPKVREAKQWMKQWQTSKGDDLLALTRMGANNSGQSKQLSANPQWHNAWVGRDDAVEVPLELVSKLAYSTNPNATEAELDTQLTRLVVLKDKWGEHFAVLMHIMGDVEYLKTCGYNLSENKYRNVASGFTGNVIYSYLDGRFCYGWRYEDGEVAGIITVQNGTGFGLQEGPTRSAGEGSCTAWYTVDYEYRCTITTTSDVGYCYWVILGYNEWMMCDDPSSLPDGYDDDDDPPSGGAPGGSGYQSPVDPCTHAQRMNSDEPAQQRLAELKDSIGAIEYGYMVDVERSNGNTTLNVKYKKGDEGHVPLVPEVGKRYREVVHTHLKEDRCAISPGDIHYIYKELYQPNLIDNIGEFRFTVLIDDHAFSLQITDRQAFERFAKDNKLNRNDTKYTKIQRNMINYFESQGIIIEEEMQNPTVSAEAMTDLFVRFLKESNSGLGVSRGVYDPTTKQPVWEALSSQGATVSARNCN